MATAPRIVVLAGVLNATTDDTPVFTPDGDTVFFDRSIGKTKSIQIAHRTGEHWSPPQTASFSGRWYDQDPAVSPDGSFVVFSSNRPTSTDGKPLTELYHGKLFRGGNLWRVNRTANGWGQPVWLGAVVNDHSFDVAPSIAGDGTVYFIRRDERAKQTFTMHIFRSQYQNGRYLPAARVPLGDAAVETHDPAVAPDQSFIIFNYGRTKGGLGRLCIAFRKGDRFSAPEDLGDAVNRDNPWGSRLGGVDYRTVYVTGTTHIWSFSLEH